MHPPTIIPAAWLALALLLPSAQVAAATREIRLAPADTQVDFTTYAMGLFPLDGHYRSFAGSLSVDPTRPSSCTVALDVEVASLEMADPGRVRLALGPKLLDQAAYPQLHFSGRCNADGAGGVLTLHGVSRPIELSTRRDGETVRATGSLRRQDFGINGLPGLIGSRILIGFSVRLPDDVARLVKP